VIQAGLNGTTPEGKIGLFWNNIFATGYAKVTNGKP
jgi:hypothetical protein